MYLFHTTKDGELAGDHLLEGKSDKEKIENGLMQIGDFLKNLTSFDHAITLLLEEVEKARKKME